VGTEANWRPSLRDAASGHLKDLNGERQLDGSNLTNQVRNIAGVTTAVAKGDLTTRITVDAQGEILELKTP